MIRWIYYPSSIKPSNYALEIVEIFKKNNVSIDSKTNEGQASDIVLAKIRKDLEKIGFRVEKGKKKEEKIYVPVLFGINGKVSKYFEADAYNPETKWVLEAEAGRAFTNYQFLKDLFQASVMHDVDFLCIAVRNDYRGRDDFMKINQFLDTLYSSNRFSTPLKGILLIGY